MSKNKFRVWIEVGGTFIDFNFKAALAELELWLAHYSIPGMHID